MNLLVLYLLLAKAVFTSFSGMASLPMVREDLVVKHHVLTDRQLSTAVVAGRTGPGPNGLYIVSVGYFVGGLPGAFVGLIALITPAFLVIPLMKFAARYANTPRIRSAIRAVVLASAGLLLAASIPLARDAFSNPSLSNSAGSALAAVIMLVTFAVLTFSRVESWWVMLGAAVVGLGAKLIA
jgi:chromate transporter